MKTLREVLEEAESKKTAIGHFNISDSEQLWGIFNVARSLNVPVIIGTSEGERAFLGPRQAVALVKSIQKEYDFPIFLNADHTYSVDGVKEAIDAGYDAVIFDGTKESFEENIKHTKECVAYARDSGREILVEGELGYIGTSSKILDEVPEGAEIEESVLTKPQIAKQFVEETGVDLLAPAVGNLHGMLRGQSNPHLDISRIQEIRKETRVPLVLHGGSGIEDPDFVEAIHAGVRIVHINTEIRVAYKKGIQLSLQENPDEIAPYRFMRGGVQEVSRVVEARLKLFASL